MLEEFYKRMKELLEDDYEAFIEALDKPNQQAIHINTNKDKTSYIATKFNLEKHPYVTNGYYFNKEDIQLGKLSYHDAGLYYIQEPSAMLVAELADVKEGMKVLDMCAAPGGKSSKLALKIGKDGLLVANDISNSRAKILSENIERFGLTNTIVTNMDPVLMTKKFAGFFDVVVVDAPCSGEGMFRKLDLAKETWSPAKVEECASIQKNLIQAACEMLKDGGELVYSTCTYELTENENQIQNALDTLPLEIIPIELKEGFTQGTVEGTIRLYPHKYKGEGHFICKMIKQDETTAIPKIRPFKSNISKEELKLLTEFYKDTLNLSVPKYIYASNHHLYAIPYPYIDCSDLKILRQGLYLGECKKNRFEPSLSLALSLQKEDVKRYYSYAYDSEQIQKYIHGETLEGNKENGFGVLFIDEYPLSFYKEVNGTLKNYYPKGLRK